MFCQHQSGHGSTEGRNLNSAALWATDIGRSLRSTAAFQPGLLPFRCKQRLLPALEVYPGIPDASQKAADLSSGVTFFYWCFMVFVYICIWMLLLFKLVRWHLICNSWYKEVGRGERATRSWEQRAPLCGVSVFVKDSKELLGPLYLWSCRGRKYLRGKAQAMLHTIFEKTLVLKFLVSKTIT